MYVCIHNETTIAHPNELTDKELAEQWLLYELECVNRGNGWVAYQGPVPYTFPEVKNE